MRQLCRIWLPAWVIALSAAGCNGGGGEEEDGAEDVQSDDVLVDDVSPDDVSVDDVTVDDVVSDDVPPDELPATGIVPADRRTTWSPGIPGGIPEAGAVHTTIDASTYGTCDRDAAGAINDAIQAAGDAASEGNIQVVLLPEGTYCTQDIINLDRSYVVLRGAGPDLTRIEFEGDGGSPAIRMGIFWPEYSPAVSVVGSVPKGATSITVSDASGIEVGDVLQIDQVDDAGYVEMGDCEWYKRGPRPDDVNGPSSPDGFRSVGQQIEVASRSGNELGLSGVMHIAFDEAFSPEVFKTATARDGEPGTRYAGLEELYVTGGNSDNIAAVNVAYSWIRNIESDGNDDAGPGMSGIHIALSHAFRCEVRGSYIHHAREINPGGGAYGISLMMQSSDNLVEDNICHTLNKPLVMNASGGGNVVAYNYVDEAIIEYNMGWQETVIDGNHCSFPHFELFEGNWAANLSSDTTHGNCGWMTFYRNYASGINSSMLPTGNVTAVGVHGYNREHTFVGNVLLQPDLVVNGVDPVYECADSGSCGDGATVYRIGCCSLGGSYEEFDDGTSLSLLYRHGNYDPVTGSVIWDEGNPDRDFPDSLYLAGKPAFFGSLDWPWVDPEGTTRVATLPAKARFDAGTPFAPPP
jgi:hypothetical protein